MSGQVIMGRVSGATVTLFRVVGGERGALVATGTTAEDGSFIVPVGASEGPFLVVATGVSRVSLMDELTALVPTFGVGTQLQRLLVTPISHLAAGLALREVRTGTATLSGASDKAWQHLNGHFGGLDWRRTLPTDVTQSTSSQVDDSARAGLILAGLSQVARTIAQQGGLTPGGSFNALSLTSALYEDLIADGHLDGLGMGGHRIHLPSVGGRAPYLLTGQAVRSILAEGVADFLSNSHNTYRMDPTDVQPLLKNLSTGSCPYLFGDGGSVDHAPPSGALDGMVPLEMTDRGTDSSPVESSAPTPQACYVAPKAGVDAVRVRVRPTVGSTALGQINRGQRAGASCEATAGGRYTACGGTSNWWVRVTWAGQTGYVAWLCVDWWHT